MGLFSELLKLKAERSFLYEQQGTRVLFVPDLGARVFIELGGLTLHRIDIGNILCPDRVYNNYGGMNFWPTPEGGVLSFNYKKGSSSWYVQDAVNTIPFILESQYPVGATAVKKTFLENRKGIGVDILMTRRFSLAAPFKAIEDLKPSFSFSYEVDDRIDVLNDVSSSDALISCWTMEQIEASEFTKSFVKVQNPKEAINFDYYSEDPREKISYYPRGFIYNTDSRQKAQIGIRKDANPEYIGFYDLERKILCVRQIVGEPTGVHFNFADNEQVHGHFSAADCYSIFNGAEDMGFFEVETISGADIQNGKLLGSRLKSRTHFGLFEHREPIERFISGIIKDSV